MGQSLKKLTPKGGSEEKEKIIDNILRLNYTKYFGEDVKSPAQFYAAIFKTVEEINRSLGYTQVRAPPTDELKKFFEKHHDANKYETLQREEFQRIVREISSNTEVTGVGITEPLLYMFGVPLTTVFVKNRVMPDAISNDVFIPAVTSLTAFFLAAFNKI